MRFDEAVRDAIRTMRDAAEYLEASPLTSHRVNLLMAAKALEDSWGD